MEILVAFCAVMAVFIAIACIHDVLGRYEDAAMAGEAFGLVDAVSLAVLAAVAVVVVWEVSIGWRKEGWWIKLIGVGTLAGWMFVVFWL